MLFPEAVLDAESHGGHDHGHSHDEPASFKYSREANERSAQHNHHGGHSHHGHGHDHGHSHGPPQKEPTPEERERYRQALHKNWDEDEDEAAGPDGGGSVWVKAISATLLISAAPFVILFFIPLDNSSEKRWLLKIFLRFVPRFRKRRANS